MALNLYNTLTRKVEIFKPLNDNQVKMYSCGPTVYDFAHIGNFRAYVCVDILKRYLKYKGFKVLHAMNITDVDDKTIKGSQKEGISLTEFTQRYEKAFFEDLEALNIDNADIFPRATEHIKEMLGITEELLKKGIAYKTDDGIYYSISKFKGYGKLSHTKIENLEANKRVKNDEYQKDQLQDFALWKFHDKDDGDVSWDASLGKGRPGWHLECSAMSVKHLGMPFDIHAGGIDLVFPHHENEIAQSEGAYDKEFAHYWFHNEHLLVNGKKMSKSLGNFFTLRDLLKKGHDPRAIRYLLLSSHYRQQLNFTEESLEAAKAALQRIDDVIDKLKDIKNESTDGAEIRKIIETAKASFEKEMDDDLNISAALAALFEFVKEINTTLMGNKIYTKDAHSVLQLFHEFDKVLGVIEAKKDDIPGEILELAKKRDEARKKKDFLGADFYRKEIEAKGYVVEDAKEGFRVKKK